MRTMMAACLAFGLGAAAAAAQSGTFEGASGHQTSGGAAIVETADGHAVRLGDDFRFDGAPDPKVALGRDGFDPGAILGALESDSGAQTYALPAGADPAAFNEVWIWCERFDVPLGVARLN